MRVQPKPKDKVALDPHRSEPRLIQVFGGGTKAAVLDMTLLDLLDAQQRLKSSWRG